jgi:hypothetical protein
MAKARTVSKMMETLEIEFDDLLILKGALITHAYRTEMRAREHADSRPVLRRHSRKRADEALRALNAIQRACGDRIITTEWLLKDKEED